MKCHEIREIPLPGPYSHAANPHGCDRTNPSLIKVPTGLRTLYISQIKLTQKHSGVHYKLSGDRQLKLKTDNRDHFADMD